MQRIALLILSTALTLTGAAPLTAAENPPLGSPDFYPSDERPVGFRGDGNGYFPGATPVLKFQEGTPVEKEIPVLGKKGSGKPRPQDRWVLTDDKSVNLCWKTKMPGFSNSQPIIVGKRVFVKTDPHWLVCVDIETGKILWQRANNPMAGRPGYSEEDLADMQSLFNFCRALQTLSYIARVDTRGEDGQEKLRRWLEENRNVVVGVKKRLEKAKVQVERLFPDLAAVVQTNIDNMQATLEKGKEPNFEGWGEIQTALNVPVREAWCAMVGWSMSAPVSDGRHVYAHYGQEQVVCYDLDGNLRWRRRVPARDLGPKRIRVQHVPSPLLIGDLLVVQAKDYLTGLDKHTGRTVWEADVSVGGGYNVGSHKHLVLKDGDRTVDVIATTPGKVLRAADGKVLADLPYSHGKEGGGPSIIGTGDIIVFEKYRDPNGPEGKHGKKKAYGYWRGRLVLEGKSVRLTDIQMLEGADGRGGPSATPILARNMIIYQEAAWDLATGKKLCRPPHRKGPREGWCAGYMVADGRLVWAADGDNRGYHRQRVDNLAMMNFRQYDISDRTAWKLISDENVLGGKNVPHHAAMEEWLPTYYENLHWHNYALPPQWGCYNSGGMFFSGNRAVILSTSHLYCIGDPDEPYNWNPASRGKALAGAK